MSAGPSPSSSSNARDTSGGEGHIPAALEYALDRLDCERDIDLVGDESDSPLILAALNVREEVAKLPSRAYLRFILEYLSRAAEPLFATDSIPRVFELVQRGDKDEVYRFADKLPSRSHALADRFLGKLAEFQDKKPLSPEDVQHIARICFRTRGEEDEAKAEAILRYMIENSGALFGIEQYESLEDIEQDYDIVWDPLLGKGTYGNVYLVTHKITQTKFAMKEIEKSRLEKNMKGRKRLRTELTILYNVRHPNLTSLKAVCDSPKTLYLIMELADQGMLLDDVLRQEAGYPEKKARQMSLDILRAIIYLHDRNVAHRDIKPDNILLAGPDKVIKLADFGLAKLMDSSMGVSLVGSHGYIAPEVLQCDKTGEDYGPNCDMWSYGCVVYVLLSGRVPFYGTLLRQQRCVLEGFYEMPDEIWDRVSPLGRDFVRKLLVVDPEKRLFPDEALAHPWFSLDLD